MMENVEEQLADRSVWPDLRACFFVYYKNFIIEYGSVHNPNDKLKEVIASMNAGFGSSCVSACQDGDGRWSIAICTPFMKVFETVQIITVLDFLFSFNVCSV